MGWMYIGKMKREKNNAWKKKCEHSNPPQKEPNLSEKEPDQLPENDPSRKELDQSNPFFDAAEMVENLPTITLPITEFTTGIV